MDWEPIETAPKDGTVINFMNVFNGLKDTGYWECWKHKTKDDRDLLPDFAKTWDGEWCTDLGNGEMSHWRHLYKSEKE